MSAQFKIKAADPASVVRLERELGLPRFIAATLVARGIDNPAAVHRFLAPSLERDWLDPYIIPGLSDVADALEAAVKRGDHILVFGDFDLDGISATTVLTRGLRALGAQATPFIPLRFEEGYALSQAAITRACSFGPDFIVTVDCGIACKAEAAAVVEAGLGLAITDHHEPVDLVPEGVPVADPKCDANCPSSILAGVGVALKLVQVLGGRLGQPHLWRDFTDFATLGTVADLMPMRDENRALVSDGIARMNAAPRPCIAALLATSFVPDFGWARGLYYAVFHSISAFCNAGFDLLGNYTSLTPYQLDPVVNLTISFLIIAGGLGFGVWRDLFKNRGHFRALKLHTRLVLVTTGGLLLGGTLLIAALEWTNPGTIAGMNFIQKIQAAFFQSVTMRTAGFNTVDLAAMHPETKFVSSILMFIGAAPASTGGGIKVTTFVLMGLFVSTVAHGRENCVIYKRTVSHATVMRAMVVALISACVVGVDLLLLTIAEQDTAFVDLMFETLSAFGTVGLSTGITPTIGTGAKLLSIVLMYIGRLGPMTVAMLWYFSRGERARYPEGNISIG